MGVKRVTVASSPDSAAVMIRLYSRSNRSRGDIALMSGGAPASGAAAMAAPTEAGACPPSFRTSVTSTMPSSAAPPTAMAASGRRAAGTPGAAPAGPPRAGVPHCAQKRESAGTSAPQPGQRCAPSGAPQLLQKLAPGPEAPQAGQRSVVEAVTRTDPFDGGTGCASGGHRAGDPPAAVPPALEPGRGERRDLSDPRGQRGRQLGRELEALRLRADGNEVPRQRPAQLREGQHFPEVDLV